MNNNDKVYLHKEPVCQPEFPYLKLKEKIRDKNINLKVIKITLSS